MSYINNSTKTLRLPSSTHLSINKSSNRNLSRSQKAFILPHLHYLPSSEKLKVKADISPWSRSHKFGFLVRSGHTLQALPSLEIRRASNDALSCTSSQLHPIETKRNLRLFSTTFPKLHYYHHHSQLPNGGESSWWWWWVRGKPKNLGLGVVDVFQSCNFGIKDNNDVSNNVRHHYHHNIHNNINQEEGDKDTTIRVKIQKIMSTMLLPIIGSPPNASDISMASSPMDDISALSSFGVAGGGGSGSGPPPIIHNRRFTLRRKLSTSFDDPVSSFLLGMVVDKKADSEGGSGAGRISGRINERRSSSTRSLHETSGAIEIPTTTASGTGGAWLEEHFKKFMGLRISECSDGGDGDDNISVGSGSSSGGGGRRRSSSVSKIHEDIFELLEKVIGFKGRNVSHITVEV
jgi:hypothetical protein